MDGATIVALAGIGGTALVGLGGPVVNAWFDARRRTEEAKRLNRQNAFQVVEEAVLAVQAAHEALGMAEHAVQQWIASVHRPWPEEITTFTKQALALVPLRHRLAARLGHEHEIVRAMSELQDLFGAAVRSFGEIRRARATPHPHVEALGRTMEDVEPVATQLQDAASRLFNS